MHSFTYGKDNLLTEYSSDVSSKVTYTYDGLNRQTKSSVALKTPLDMSYTYYDSNRGENFTTTKIKEEPLVKILINMSMTPMAILPTFIKR